MRLVAMLLSGLSATAVLSSQEGCKGYALSNGKCYCGPTLANLIATPPEGLRIVAVCGLRSMQPTPHWYDLTREKVNLDPHSQVGGVVYLSGTTKVALVGTVTSWGASEAGGPDLTFDVPSTVDAMERMGFGIYFDGLRLGTNDYKTLKAPRAADNDCWSAQATLKIRNPVVILGEGDQAGTLGVIEVVDVSEFQHHCGR